MILLTFKPVTITKINLKESMFEIEGHMNVKK